MSDQRNVVRKAVRLLMALFIIFLGFGHLAFSMANFQPGYPKLEGVTALVAGLALISSVFVARHSAFAALITVFVGTVPLFLWFTYAVPEVSDPVFLYQSAVLPIISATGALLLWRRNKITKTKRN